MSCCVKKRCTRAMRKHWVCLKIGGASENTAKFPVGVPVRPLQPRTLIESIWLRRDFPSYQAASAHFSPQLLSLSVRDGRHRETKRGTTGKPKEKPEGNQRETKANQKGNQRKGNQKENKRGTQWETKRETKVEKPGFK